MDPNELGSHDVAFEDERGCNAQQSLYKTELAHALRSAQEVAHHTKHDKLAHQTRAPNAPPPPPLQLGTRHQQPSTCTR